MTLRPLLGRLFRRQARKDQWLGLDQDQLETVQALFQTPGWQHYTVLLEEVLAQQAQPLLSGLLEQEKYLYQAGVVGAIRRLQQLPDHITAHLRTLNDRTRRSQPAVNQFVNSVWYDLARRAGLTSNGKPTE